MSDQCAGHLIGRIQKVAGEDPDRPALVSPTRQISYAALWQCVSACAQALNLRGIGAGSTVVFQCDDEVPHLTLSLALFLVGAKQLAVAAHESDIATGELAQRAGASQQLSGDDVKALVAASSEASCSGDTPASVPGWIYLSTSGTTGQPKIVVLHEEDIVAQAPRHVLTPEERFACIATVEHNFAKRHRLYCLAMGATNVFLPAQREGIVDACLSLGVSTLHVSVFQAQELLGLEGVDALRGVCLKLGGSHASFALRRSLIERITPDLYAGYGTTETGAIGFAAPDEHDESTVVGRPLPGLSLRIVDGDRAPLPQGERGEVAVHADGLFRGYLNQDALTGQRYANGWFYTGDIGQIDARGCLALSGRIDDMFVFNSMNIYPQELEAIIRTYSGIRDAVVLPKPSPQHGDVPVALVHVDDPDLDERALRRFVQSQAGLRCPRQFVRVSEIPRNSAGKILREQAQKLLSGGAS